MNRKGASSCFPVLFSICPSSCLGGYLAAGRDPADTEVYIMELFENVIMPVLMIVLIIGAAFLISKKNSTRKNTHFDEMQLKIRGNGYKIGFFVTLAALFVFALLFELSDTFGSGIDPSFCIWTAGFAGIVSFVVYCIFKDAFYSIGQNRKYYIIICFLVILTNGIGASRHISEGTLIEDGAVKFSNCGSLLCAVSFLIILVSLIVREGMSRKEVAE